MGIAVYLLRLVDYGMLGNFYDCAEARLHWEAMVDNGSDRLDNVLFVRLLYTMMDWLLQ